MTYLSICSGIEAASVAWEPLGWKPCAFAEIEKFPTAVLAHHWPQVPNLGDMTKHKEWSSDILSQADVFVGGTPCQAFSVAGLRNSLSDERGNLSLIYINLLNQIDEERNRIGRPPAICVYENVPGILNTKDNAFGCFLGGLAGSGGALEPPDSERGWSDVGYVRGPQRRVAWRILDAQYFGLAQRRRRVFLVASARNGFCPAQVLLIEQGLHRYSPPSRKTRQGSAYDLAPCLAASGRGFDRTGDTRGQDCVIPAIVGSLDTECGAGRLTHQSLQNGHIMPEIMGTMTARMFNALGARDVEEGALLPISFYPTNRQPEFGNYDDLSPAVKVGSSGSSGNPPAVAFAKNTRDEVREITVDSDQCEGTVACYDYLGTQGGGIEIGISPTLKKKDGVATVTNTMQVRRLTPRECERLQGFPDDHTLVPWRGKTSPDGPRYKALGNSMAVPVMRWIGQRIAQLEGGEG